ncbi:hypothetical protein HHK36_015911 [Tetracentron sinense]|uniref:AAA+ ATPase domain-containing protein n=1 Tax=Tetracentron sinense TaxID=13715 RepID=A0A835DGM6_TETSI|nr:hypothetical protein HHK36_015911 [Tetracentron sinense]
MERRWYRRLERQRKKVDLVKTGKQKGPTMEFKAVGIMASAPCAFVGPCQIRFRGCRKHKNSVKMMCSLQAPRLRIRNFSGLGRSNTLDTMVIPMVGESSEVIAAVVGGSSGNTIPTLEVYGTNLTKLAEEGKLDPVEGRQQEIESVTQILGRLTKNNPCLIGEHGVGKTAIVKGLAQRITSGDVPETIEGKKSFDKFILWIFRLLVAGTRGQFEEILKKMMEEIKRSGDIILFIDECIGATTPDDFRKHIENYANLERQFEIVKVPEPSVDETIQILKVLRELYEVHHKLRYTDDALVAVAQLSYQYISDRCLPEKAIDLIDEAGSQVKWVNMLCPLQLPEEVGELSKITKEKNQAVRSEDWKKVGDLRDLEIDLKAQISKAKSEAGDVGPTVTKPDIQRIVFSWTEIPVERVSGDEPDRLLKMEEKLCKRVIPHGG